MADLEPDILIIEDSDEDAELTIRALKKHNLKILRLIDGVEGLDFMNGNGKFSNRNLSAKPRVIFLDLKMPRIDGLEVLSKIKSNNDTKSIPVVVLASTEDDPNIKRAYDLGANSYIVKPVDAENFMTTITGLGLYWLFTNKV
jgi:two-component system, response regulator